jgi:hypothetical protein
MLFSCKATSSKAEAAECLERSLLSVEESPRITRPCTMTSANLFTCEGLVICLLIVTPQHISNSRFSHSAQILYCLE